MALETLRDLMIDELRDLYNAEHQHVKLLPQMARAASASALRLAFDRHMAQTVNQALRLDRIVVRRLGIDPGGRRSRSMEGLVAQARDLLEQQDTGSVLDAALVAAAQRIEHYEIAAYGTVVAYAKQLGLRDAMQLLRETLQGEEETDKKLTQIAQTVNLEAAEAQPEAVSRSRSTGNKTRSAL